MEQKKAAFVGEYCAQALLDYHQQRGQGRREPRTWSTI